MHAPLPQPTRSLATAPCVGAAAPANTPGTLAWRVNGAGAVMEGRRGGRARALCADAVGCGREWAPVERLAAFLTGAVAHTGPFAPVALFGAASLAIARALRRRRREAR